MQAEISNTTLMVSALTIFASFVILNIERMHRESTMSNITVFQFNPNSYRHSIRNTYIPSNAWAIYDHDNGDETWCDLGDVGDGHIRFQQWLSKKPFKRFGRWGLEATWYGVHKTSQEMIDFIRKW